MVLGLGFRDGCRLLQLKRCRCMALGSADWLEYEALRSFVVCFGLASEARSSEPNVGKTMAQDPSKFKMVKGNYSTYSGGPGSSKPG